MQRLAAGLIAGCHGLGHGHAGAICDVLTAAGINSDHWSARQITAALNADMTATGYTWPDQITCPAAFLATRLKRIDWTPPPANDGGYAAGPDKKQPTPEAAGPEHANRQTQQEARHARVAAQVAARTEHAHARDAAQAALGGPGHTAARAALATALATRRRTTAQPAAPGADIVAPPPSTYVPFRSVNIVPSFIDVTQRNG